MRVALLVLCLLGGCAAGGFWWYRHTHVVIDDAGYAVDAETLDLRGQDISFDHYLAVRQALPDCQVVWDVPFQGGRVSSASESLTVTTLTEQDIRLLGYFPKLRRIDAIACTDYALLEELQSAWPELEVS